MEKAYEIKALGAAIAAEAKKDGLHLAEEALESLGKAAYLGLKKWAQESAALSESKVDDAIAPFYNFIDPLVLPLIEKIDLDADGK